MQSSPPHLNETRSAAPHISPGFVEDDEFLLREMYDPQHFSNGEVAPSAASINDLSQNGLSVHRMKHVSVDFVRKSIGKKLLDKKIKGTPWASEGVAKTQTSKVRELRTRDGQQAFFVIDTATIENPGHASIYFAHTPKSKKCARRARGLLVSLLQNIFSLDEVFNKT